MTRFTFFGQVYEQRDLGNGLFSLKKIKDLSTAFGLVAKSGTSGEIVYPTVTPSIDADESMEEIIADINPPDIKTSTQFQHTTIMIQIWMRNKQPIKLLHTNATQKRHNREISHVGFRHAAGVVAEYPAIA